MTGKKWNQLFDETIVQPLGINREMCYWTAVGQFSPGINLKN